MDTTPAPLTAKLAQPPAEDGPLLGIGAAAARAGVSERALRYYQELGLIVPAGTTPGGLRRYSEENLSPGGPRELPGRSRGPHGPRPGRAGRPGWPAVLAAPPPPRAQASVTTGAPRPSSARSPASACRPGRAPGPARGRSSGRACRR